LDFGFWIIEILDFGFWIKVGTCSVGVVGSRHEKIERIGVGIIGDNSEFGLKSELVLIGLLDRGMKK
jgi:hypothetical protein